MDDIVSPKCKTGISVTNGNPLEIKASHGSERFEALFNSSPN